MLLGLNALGGDLIVNSERRQKLMLLNCTIIITLNINLHKARELDLGAGRSKDRIA
ncbi:hypothetical protein D3C78_1834360 [compost metagenome]